MLLLQTWKSICYCYFDCYCSSLPPSLPLNGSPPLFLYSCSTCFSSYSYFYFYFYFYIYIYIYIYSSSSSSSSSCCCCCSCATARCKLRA